MKACIVLVFFLLGCAFGQIDVSFSGNVTLDNADAFGFREIATGAFSVPGLFDGLGFETTAASVSNTSASFNVSAGAAWAALGTAAPTSYLAYFQSAVNWNLKNPAINWASADVSAAAGVIGSSYLALIEVESNKTIIPTGTIVDLKTMLWSLKQANTTDSGLVAYTFRGTKPVTMPNLVVEVSFIISNRLGKLNLGATVTPASLEVVVNITNFPYTSNTSSCQLWIAVAAAAADASAAGQLISNKGSNQTYFNLNANANIGGTVSPVSIGAWVDGGANTSFGFDNSLKAQMDAHYAAGWVAKLVHVTFPAQASSIIYDPAMGAGAMPQATDDSGMSTKMIVIIVVSIVAGVAVLAGAIYAIYRCNKSEDETYRPIAH